jgi:hypothetical protein
MMRIKIMSVDWYENMCFVVYKIKNAIFTISIENTVSDILSYLKKIHNDQ